MRRNNFKMRRMYIVKSERKVWLHYSCSAAIIDDLFSGNFTVIQSHLCRIKMVKVKLHHYFCDQYKSQTKSHALFCLHRQFDWWNMAKKKRYTPQFDSIGVKLENCMMRPPSQNAMLYWHVECVILTHIRLHRENWIWMNERNNKAAFFRI